MLSIMNKNGGSKRGSLAKKHSISVPDGSPGWTFWRRRRYVVALMAFFGFFNAYSLRVNLTIAIVDMTANKTVTSKNGTVSYGQEFDWDSKLQGFILSSFYYGYITTQILGGFVASKIGGKRLFGFGIGMTALLTLLIPWLTRTNVYFLMAVRIIEGIFEGVTYPSIHALWAQWAPPLERSRLATTAFSGSYAGTVFSMPVCAYLANTFGWPSIYYFFGVLGIFWYILWTFLIFENPEDDPHISAEELKYIVHSLGRSKQSSVTVKHPWKAMLTSVPVYAIIVSHFSENWGFYTMLTQIPTFMKQILNFELGKTGLMAALPYLAMSIMILFSGYLADWFRVKGIMTTTQVRKTFNCGGFIAQTVFMLGAAYLSEPLGSMICLTLAVGIGGFSWAGFSVNYLDIAPQHASVLMGIGNTFATLPGIISPILTGYIVTTPSKEEWQIVFYLACSIYLFGCIFYGCCASGELQPWAFQYENYVPNKKAKRGSIVNSHPDDEDKTFQLNDMKQTECA